MAVKLEFFSMPLNFLALVANTQATSSLQVPADANFIWTHAHYFADVAAAGQTDATRVVPLITLFLQNGYTGRNLVGNPNNSTNAQNSAHLTSIFGGRQPLELPKPLMFAANSFINVSVFNHDAAQTYNLRLTFIGYKQFEG